MWISAAVSIFDFLSGMLSFNFDIVSVYFSILSFIFFNKQQTNLHTKVLPSMMITINSINGPKIYKKIIEEPP